MLTAIFAPGAVAELLTDYKVASRMLIAVPILLFGQILMESKFRTIVSTAREDLVALADMPRFDEILATWSPACAIRCCPSWRLPRWSVCTLPCRSAGRSVWPAIGRLRART